MLFTNIIKIKKRNWGTKKRKCCVSCFPETFVMGDNQAEGEAKLVPSSTRDLLQKLNQSIKSVEQEMLFQQAAVHMSNLKVLKMPKSTCKSYDVTWQYIICNVQMP